MCGIMPDRNYRSFFGSNKYQPHIILGLILVITSIGIIDVVVLYGVHTYEGIMVRHQFWIRDKS